MEPIRCIEFMQDIAELVAENKMLKEERKYLVDVRELAPGKIDIPHWQN